MASRRGPVVMGTDGTDYNYRQKVAAQYQISSLNKSRLRYCIFLHYLLFLLMLVKLSADILDRLDIFILEIEELEVPKPLLWEYVWAGSISATLFGLTALKKNKLSAMIIYASGNLILGLLPILYALFYYFDDFWEYITTRSKENIHVWQGFPYALLWYAFLIVGLQIHSFALYFARNLITAWKSRTGSTKQTKNKHN